MALYSRSASATGSEGQRRQTGFQNGGVAAGLVESEVLSFACDPCAPVALNGEQVALLTESTTRHGVRARVLTLQGTDLLSDGNSGVRTLSNFLSTNTTLRELDVAMCRLGNLSVSDLVHACSQTRRTNIMNNVVTLNLSMNGVTDEGMLRIARVLVHAPTNLRVFIAKYNPLTLAGVGAFLAVDVALSLLDVSHCLLEARDETSEVTERNVKEMCYGLRLNGQTEALLADGCASYLTPKAMRRMLSAAEGNNRSCLTSSVQQIQQQVEAAASVTRGSVTRRDATIREYVERCFDRVATKKQGADEDEEDEQQSGGTVASSASRNQFDEDEGHTPARRSTRAIDNDDLVEASGKKDFPSPFVVRATPATQRTYSIAPPPVADERWPRNPQLPIPSSAVAAAVAEIDGPVLAAVKAPGQNRASGQRTEATDGKSRTGRPVAASRQFAVVNVRPVERQLNIRRKTSTGPPSTTKRSASGGRAHVDPTAPPPPGTARSAYRSTSMEDHTTYTCSPVRRSRSGGEGSALVAPPRQFKFLYERAVPVLTSRKATPPSARVTSIASPPAPEADPPRRVVDARPLIKQHQAREQRRALCETAAANRAGALGARRTGSVLSFERSSSKTGSRAPLSRSASATGSRGGSPARRSHSTTSNPMAAGTYGRTSSVSSAAATPPSGTVRGISSASGMMLSSVEKAGVMRRLLAWCSASDEQIVELLGDGIVELLAEGSAPAEGNGIVRRGLPASLVAAEGRPSVIAKYPLGSEERTAGLAKVLWCLMFHELDLVSCHAGNLGALDADMTKIPVGSEWDHKDRPLPRDKAVQFESLRRAEDTRARRLMEAAMGPANQQQHKGNSGHESRFRSASTEWVQKRRASREADADEARKGDERLHNTGVPKGRPAPADTWKRPHGTKGLRGPRVPLMPR